MIYRSYTPSWPLSEFVDRFWICSDSPPHRRERILPSGTIELVINLCDNEIRIYDPYCSLSFRRFSGAVVSGPYSGCFVIDPQQHASILGVHFKPGGTFPFLNLPAGELVDAHFDLETIWGRTANQLRERLCTAATADERFALLEEALVLRIRNSQGRHRAVSTALRTFEQTSGRARIGDVASDVGLSQRRFIQVFAAEVGLTPKLYCRILRFQRARECVRDVPAPDWSRVAARCGYFDQSHLIRDFQEFSGLSPANYLCQSSEQVLPNHVPLVG